MRKTSAARWPVAAAVVIAGLNLAGCASAQTAAITHTGNESDVATHTPTAAPNAYRFTYAPTAVGAACLADLKTAAALALTDVGQDPAPGNAQLLASGTDCLSIDEWVTAANMYPGAMGNPNTDARAIAYNVGAICGSLPSATAVSAPLCAEDKKLGLNFGIWQ